MWRKRSRPPQFARAVGQAAAEDEEEERVATRSWLGRQESLPARPASGFKQLLSQQNAIERPEAPTTIIERVQRVARDLERAEGMETADGKRTTAAERAGHLMGQSTLKPDDSNHHHHHFSHNQSPHKLIDNILESSSSALNSSTSAHIEQLQLQLAPSTNSSESLQRVLFERLRADAELNLSSDQQHQINTSATPQRQPTGELDFFLPLFVLLVSINLIVILGNILVIVAVHANAKLRNVTNIFIVSLATADLLLGLFVLPYALVYEVLDVWVFGQIWCRGWLVTDVWISTASILNLCAISIDRYVAVTRPVKYRSIMTNRRAKCIVAIVWILAFIISLPPLLTELGPSSGQTTTSSSLSPASSTPASDDKSPGSSWRTTIPHNTEPSSVSRRRRRSLAATAGVLIRDSLESASWITEPSAENNVLNDAPSLLIGSEGIMKQVGCHDNNRNWAADQQPTPGHAGGQTMADESLLFEPNLPKTAQDEPSVRSRRMASANRGQVSSGSSRGARLEMPKANEFSWRRFETSADSKRFQRSTSASSERIEPLQSGASSRPPLRMLDTDRAEVARHSFMGSTKGSEARSVPGRPALSTLENIKTATTTTEAAAENGCEEIKLPFGLFIVLNENSAERFQVADDRGERDDDDEDAPHKSWRLSWLSALLNAPLECHHKSRKEKPVQSQCNCFLSFVLLEHDEREENRSSSTGGRSKAGARCWMRPAPLQVREAGQQHQRQQPAPRPPTTRSLSDGDYFGGGRPRGENPSVINDNEATEANANEVRRTTNMAGAGDAEQFCLGQLLELVCESSLRPLKAQVHLEANRRKQPNAMRSIFLGAIDCFGQHERQVAPAAQWRRPMAELALKLWRVLIGKASHRPRERLAFHPTGDASRRPLPNKSTARVSSFLEALAKTTIGPKEEAVLEHGDDKVRLVELAHVSRDAQTATAASEDRDRRRRGTRAGDGGGIEPATTKAAVGLQPAAAAGLRSAAERNEEAADSSGQLKSPRGDFISNRKMDYYAHEGTRRDGELERDWNERQQKTRDPKTSSAAGSDSVSSRPLSGPWQRLPLDHKDDLGHLIDELHFNCHSNGPARSCSRCISLLPLFELTSSKASAGRANAGAPNGGSTRANPKAPTSIGHVVVVLAAEWARLATAPIRGVVSNGRSLADQDVAEGQSNSLAKSVASELSGPMEWSRGYLLAVLVGPNSKAPRRDSAEGDPAQGEGRAWIDNGIRAKDESEKGGWVEGVAEGPKRNQSRPRSRRDVKMGAAYSLGAISSLAGRAPAQSANDQIGTKAQKRAVKTFVGPFAPAKTDNEAAAARLARKSPEQLWHNNNEDDDGDDINDYFAASRPTGPSKHAQSLSSGPRDFGPVESARSPTRPHTVNSSVKLEQVAGSGLGPSQRVAAGEMRPLNRLRRDIDSNERSADSAAEANGSGGEGAPPVGPRRKSGCALFHQKTYVVYSALGSFFIPMLVMVFFYSRIYLVASRAQKAMQRGYMTTKWPPLATNKQNAAQNSKRQSNFQTGSASSTRSAWPRASFKRSSVSQARSSDGGEPTRSSRTISRENSASGALSESRRFASRDQELSNGSELGAGCASSISPPERVTLRIHRRTEPPQQQAAQSQTSQTPSFKALALKSAALIKSYNQHQQQQQQQQQQSSVAASRMLRAISNESQNTATTVDDNGNKSSLMQMIAVEQKLSLKRASTGQRRTRFSLDKGADDRQEVRANRTPAPSQPQSTARKRSSLPLAIRIAGAPATEQEAHATGAGVGEDNKLNGGEEICEKEETCKVAESNGSAHEDHNQSMVISIDASGDRCRHHDHAHKKPRRHVQDGADHHHHHHHRHPHRHRHHRHRDYNNCPSTNRAKATSAVEPTECDQQLKLAANSIQITIENNVDETADELENGTGSGVQLESYVHFEEDSEPVPLRRTDRSQSQAVTPTIVVNWNPESGQAASQFAKVPGQQLMQASMPILPLAPTSTAIVVDSNRKSQLEATAATMHQSLSGSGLSLVATIPQQVRKQSMMLLSSITSRSGQTLRRLSMVAAHPVDSLLLKSRANSSTSGASRRRNRRHNRRSCSSSSALSHYSTGSCRSSSLSESSGAGLAAADEDDDQNRDRKTDRMLNNDDAQAHPQRGRNSRTGDRFGSSSSEHEIGVDHHGRTFDGGARKSGKAAHRADLASSKLRRTRSATGGAASPKKTLDDYLMAVAGIDNSSDEQEEEEDDEEEEEEGQSDSSLSSSPPSKSSSSSSSSSSNGASNLTSMLRKENLLIPTIAIIGPESNSENMIQTIESSDEQEKKSEVSSNATRRSSLKDHQSSSEKHHQMEQQLDLLDKQVRRSEHLPPTAGLHRQGALYESATSRRQSQVSSLSNSGETGPREKSPMSPMSPTKQLVNESNLSNGQHQSRSPDLFRLLDPKARAAMNRSELGSNGEPKSNQIVVVAATTSNATGARRRGLKRTSRWHAKRLRAETKAAKTVGIIVGGFIFCWLPFFTAYLSRAIICSSPSCIPQTWLSLSIWLGYINSAINPVIYGLFSADFRQAFKSIVCRCSLRSNQVQTPSRHHHQRAGAQNNYRGHYHARSTPAGHESAVLGTLADGILKSFL